MVSETQKVTELLGKFAVTEDKAHTDEYNRVAMAAKAEGHADVEAMLCAYAAQEKEIADSARKVTELLGKFAVTEDKAHTDEYNRVAMAAKAEGHADVEAMLCAYAAQEKEIADSARKVAGAF